MHTNGALQRVLWWYQCVLGQNIRSDKTLVMLVKMACMCVCLNIWINLTSKAIELFQFITSKQTYHYSFGLWFPRNKLGGKDMEEQCYLHSWKCEVLNSVNNGEKNKIKILKTMVLLLIKWEQALPGPSLQPLRDKGRSLPVNWLNTKGINQQVPVKI